MAEGLLRARAGDRFEVASAGTKPAGLNPLAVETMAEIGIDISGHRSKHVNDFHGQTFDCVVTVCDRAKETCPIYPSSSTLLHWSFDDPAAERGLPDQRRAVFRRVRDEIASRIDGVLLRRG
jgi:arsenate reductase